MFSWPEITDCCVFCTPAAELHDFKARENPDKSFCCPTHSESVKGVTDGVIPCLLCQCCEDFADPGKTEPQPVWSGEKWDSSHSDCQKFDQGVVHRIG